jgi:hypothetical protein
MESGAVGQSLFGVGVADGGAKRCDALGDADAGSSSYELGRTADDRRGDRARHYFLSA